MPYDDRCPGFPVSLDGSWDDQIKEQRRALRREHDHTTAIEMAQVLNWLIEQRDREKLRSRLHVIDGGR